MAANDEQRQVKTAAELAEDARRLAHSTRHVPHPSDAYALLGELSAAQWSLTTVLEQLAGWHLKAEEGVHHSGEDHPGEFPADVIAAAHLIDAADAAKTAAEFIDRAHTATGTIQWFDDVHEVTVSAGETVPDATE